MQVKVWWVIDTESDRVVGSRHSAREARALVKAHKRETLHASHVKRVTMSVPPA